MAPMMSVTNTPAKNRPTDRPAAALSVTVSVSVSAGPVSKPGDGGDDDGGGVACRHIWVFFQLSGWFGREVYCMHHPAVPPPCLVPTCWWTMICTPCCAPTLPRTHLLLNHRSGDHCPWQSSRGETVGHAGWHASNGEGHGGVLLQQSAPAVAAAKCDVCDASVLAPSIAES